VRGTNLTEAFPAEATLMGANLEAATSVTPAQLASAKSLEGATGPDGRYTPMHAAVTRDPGAMIGLSRLGTSEWLRQPQG
jgi:hypothetical protein